jgi:hypothetical protein
MIMNNSRYPHLRMLMAGLLSWAAAFAAPAAETVVMQPPLQYADTSGDGSRQARVQSRFISDFGEFAGSEDNARSLYSGLRNGTQITLASTTTAGGGAAGTAVVQFEPPTRPMGNGNVFISTALARQQLASYGITNPTPQQLQAALTGGTIIPADATAKPVVLKGILVQRADGMGWGSIAKASGTNLGKVVSGLNNPASANTAGSTSAGSGVTTACGLGLHALARHRHRHRRSRRRGHQHLCQRPGGQPCRRCRRRPCNRQRRFSAWRRQCPGTGQGPDQAIAGISPAACPQHGAGVGNRL